MTKVSWSTAIKHMFEHTCVGCGHVEEHNELPSMATRHHAHHVKPRSQFPNEQFDPLNGIEVCYSCHSKLHFILKNDEEKYYEWCNKALTKRTGDPSNYEIAIGIQFNPNYIHIALDPVHQKMLKELLLDKPRMTAKRLLLDTINLRHKQLLTKRRNNVKKE